MGILRSDRITGLGGANAITGSTFFGNSSADGNNGNSGDSLIIETGTTDDFAFGTGDFTIEFWFNRVLSTHQQHFYDFRGTTNTNTVMLYMVNNVMYYFGNASERITSGTVPSGEWVHFALVRSSASTKMYFNGTQTGSTYSDSLNLVGPDKGSGFIGSNGGTDGIIPSGSFLIGHISNFRVQKGKAEYTAAFTPPTHRLEKTPETVLLTCNSSSNVLNEETGKVVTPSSLNTNSTGPIASRFTPNTPVGFSTTTDVGSQYGTTFDGFTVFATSTYMVPPGGNTRERNRGRGVFAGGYAPSPASLRNIIDYVEIQSTGNAIDFGDLLSINNGEGGACSSSTRALFGGGQSNIVDITFITIANTSNVTDFGDLITGRRSLSAVSSDTKGLFAGGTTPAMKNEIESVTIATAGNASDFGDLTVARRNMAPNSSSTRGVFAGGNPGSSPLLDDTIDFVTIASAGNATDFGNLITAMREQGGSSSATRGLIAGGFTSPANLNTIEFITIATTGNASDFGDLHTAVSGLSGTSNGTRGIFAGGAYINNIQYVTIASTGNAEDFGDLTAARFLYDGTSDSHGGLS